MTLGPVWDHFWHIKVIWGAFRGHFEVTLSISTSNFICDACVMRTYTGLVGPKSGNVEKRLVFKAFLKGSKEPGGSQECKESVEKYHFGITLGPLLLYSSDSMRLYHHFGIIV